MALLSESAQGRFLCFGVLKLPQEYDLRCSLTGLHPE